MTDLHEDLSAAFSSFEKEEEKEEEAAVAVAEVPKPVLEQEEEEEEELPLAAEQTKEDTQLETEPKVAEKAVLTPPEPTKEANNKSFKAPVKARSVPCLKAISQRLKLIFKAMPARKIHHCPIRVSIPLWSLSLSNQAKDR